MRDNLAIVRSILSKTVSRGATVGEEAAAVAKAVEMMGKYAIPHSAVASIWPKGWGFDGKRVDPSQQRTRPRGGGNTLESMIREMQEKYGVDVREAIRRAAEMAKQYDRPRPKVSPEDIADLEEFIRKHSGRTGSAKGFKTKASHQREHKPGSIGDYARQLLRSNIKDVGPYSYGYILGRILDRYPNAKTTVASLRWYENEMRNKGLDIPKGRPAKG